MELTIELRKKHLPFAAIVVIALIYFLFQMVFPDDQRIIKGRLQEIIVLASFNKQLHPLEKLRTAKDISEYFTNPVYIKINHKDSVKEKTLSTDNLIKELTLAHSYVEWIKIRILESKIEVLNDSATAKIKLSVEGRGKNEDKKFLEELEVELRLQKKSGDWLIESGENITVVDRKSE